MNFWEAYQKMKQGHKIARKCDKPCIYYTNSKILRFDDRYGIVDNNTCVANISAVELEATNWEIVNPNFLIPWKEEYKDLNGDMFLSIDETTKQKQETDTESLKNALKKAEDALYFYAQKSNYSKDSMFDSKQGEISQVDNDNGRLARNTLTEIEKSGFSKYGLLVYYKDGSEKILKYKDDDDRDEDLRRLEFSPDVESVSLYPI